MPSPAKGVFDHLDSEIGKVFVLADAERVAGNLDALPTLYRCCIVLTVASFDSYMHEQGNRLLFARGQLGGADAVAVGGYLSASAADISGPYGQGYVRLGLSVKTLVDPNKVDALLTAADLDAPDIWLKTAIALGERPDRLRRKLQLQYDRRNDIAHAGDWDSAALAQRACTETHALDCRKCIQDIVSEIDGVIP